MSRTKKCMIIFLIIILVLVLLSLLIVWLITMANKIKFHVIGADLTQFNFTDDNQLLFDLTVNMKVKNPNRAFGVFFDRIEVTLLYQDIKFSNASMSPFYQGQDGSKLLKLKFDGQQLMNLNAEQLAVFGLEKLVEIFTLKLELRLQIRVNIDLIKIKLKPKVHCGLNLPLISRGRTFLRFQIIGCHVAY
ncbi:NDR1/HIN1-like protein 3 [Cucurbita maxima]|uniref:NDR1/HIN1-like protein 3 n=1 Tax=Cucurbita maxima TaxID=3661 RepID=A0A6J1KYH7_CUCMA|nr:NDR1/HIN1-like protein 3 [Cucurbita maxima]